MADLANKSIFLERKLTPEQKLWKAFWLLGFIFQILNFNNILNISIVKEMFGDL